LRRDTFRHQGLRQHLIDELRRQGIKDEKVLEAMLKLPRHMFLEKAFEEWAYKNVAFPIGCEQTISQPQTVAIQTSLLEIKKGDKILEVGTGSGYQACILNLLGPKFIPSKGKAHCMKNRKSFYAKWALSPSVLF
jgi:protein-L-isoaspartate(D-aspartate) O-methyltransferase